MHNTRNTVIFSLSSLLIIIVVSILMIKPFLDHDTQDFQDIELRNSLAGSLDVLVVGSCSGKYAYSPEVIDNSMNCNSYNLCGIHTSPDGVIALLSEEIDNNPLKLVIIDVDYDSLSYTTKGTHALGGFNLIPRLRDDRTRLSYLLNHMHFEDYDVIYSKYMLYGLHYWKTYFTGNMSNKCDPKDKGHSPAKSKDFTIYTDYTTEKNKESIDTSVIEDNDRKMEKLITMCKSRNIDVIMVMAPCTDSFVWTHSGWDEVHEKVADIASRNSVPYLDYNLLKKKNEFFSDRESYEKDWHLASKGADVFSEHIARLILRISNGQDISEEFYSSYEDALVHSPYNK